MGLMDFFKGIFKGKDDQPVDDVAVDSTDVTESQNKEDQGPQEAKEENDSQADVSNDAL